MTPRPIKQALHQIHSIVGLTVSLVLACVGVTGALMSFEDEVVDALNKDIIHLAARSTAVLTPDALIRQIEADNTGAKVSGLTLSSDPASAARARFAREASGARRSSIYVDPYDGRTLGTPVGEETFATIRRLHRWLLLPGDGDGYGRWITGASLLCLFALLISGIVLRWPRRARSLKMWFKPNFALHGRGFYWSLHSVVGTWLIHPHLCAHRSSSPDCGWSSGWYRDAATWLLGGPQTQAAASQKAKTKGPSDPAKGAKAQRAPSVDRPAVSVDPAWTAFVGRFGATYATATLMVPANPNAPVRIRSVSKDAPSESARDDIRIDATGRIVSAELYADKTAGESIMARMLDIHTGQIFGLVGRIVVMLAAALMPLFTVTGCLLYLSRRRLRAAAAAASASAHRDAGPQPATAHGLGLS